jgi:hypothetical protein
MCIRDRNKENKLSLPNPGMSFTAFDPLTASEQNDLVENIESLADGTGFDAGAIGGPSLDFAATGAGGIWWEEIGRTTLSVAGDTITVSSLPVRKYLRFIVSIINTGAAGCNMTFNGDTGANYAHRYTVGGAFGTAATSNNIGSLFNNTATGTGYAVVDLMNISTSPKAGTSTGIEGTTSAASVPTLTVIAFKWTNATDAISSVTFSNAAAGDYAIGSEAVVLGKN